MRKRPDSMESTRRRNGTEDGKEEVMSRVLVNMHGKMRELEGKYKRLVSQCQGVLKDNKTRLKDQISRSRETSFMEESQYQHQLRALDSDKEKVESELNYILKAKQSLNSDLGSQEDEAVQEVYSGLSEALRLAQTKALKLLQGADWNLRTQVSDLFTGLSDEVWTQVSTLRARTESKEMKDILNEVQRLEQSRQVLDLQVEEFQESIRQRYKSRHRKDKQQIALLLSENKRLESRLEDVPNKNPHASGTSSLNLSRKESTRHSAGVRNNRTSVSPISYKRVSERKDEIIDQERAFSLDSADEEVSSIQSKSLSRNQKSMVGKSLFQEREDLAWKLKTVLAASKRYVARSQGLVKRARDRGAEDALYALIQIFNSVTLDESIDSPQFRGSVSYSGKKENLALEQTNKALEMENSRLESQIREERVRCTRLFEAVETLQQRIKPDQSESLKRLSQENNALSLKLKDLERALDAEIKATKKAKKEHNSAIEDLVKDCTELTAEVKALNDEKAKLKSSYERKLQDFAQETTFSLKGFQEVKNALRKEIEKTEGNFKANFSPVEDSLGTMEQRIESLKQTLNNSLMETLRKMTDMNEAFRLKEREMEVMGANAKSESERLRSALEQQKAASELLATEHKVQATSSERELARLRSDVKSQKSTIERQGKMLDSQTTLTERLTQDNKGLKLQLEVASAALSESKVELKSLAEEKNALEKRCEELLGLAEEHSMELAQFAEGGEDLHIEEAEAHSAVLQEGNLASEAPANLLQDLETALQTESLKSSSLQQMVEDLTSLNEKLSKDVETALKTLTEERKLAAERLEKMQKTCFQLKSEMESYEKRGNLADENGKKVEDQLKVALEEKEKTNAELILLKEENKAKILGLEQELLEKKRKTKEKIKDFTIQISQKDSEIAHLQQGIATLNSDFSQLEAAAEELASLKSRFEDINSDRTKLQATVQILLKEKQAISNQIQEVETDLGNARRVAEELEGKSRNLTNEIDRIRKERREETTAFQRENMGLQNQIQALTDSIAGIQQEKDLFVSASAETGRTCEALKKQIQALMLELQAVKEDKTSLTASFSKVSSLAKTLQSQLTEATEAGNNQVSVIRSQDAELGALRRTNEQLQRQLTALTDSLSSSEAKKDGFRQETEALNVRIQAQVQEIQSITKTTAALSTSLSEVSERNKSIQNQLLEAQELARTQMLEIQAKKSELEVSKNANLQLKTRLQELANSAELTEAEKEESRKKCLEEIRAAEGLDQQIQAQLLEIQSLKERNVVLATSLSDISAKNTGLQSQLSASEADKNRSIQELEAKTSEFLSISQQFQTSKTSLERAMNDLRTTKQDLSRLWEWLTNAYRSCDFPKVSNPSETHLFSTLQDALDQARVLNGQLKLWAKEFDVKVSADFRGSLDAINEVIKRIITENKATDSDLLNAKIEDQSREIERLTDKLRTADANLAVFQLRFNAQNRAVSQTQSDLKSLKTMIETLRKSHLSDIKDVETRLSSHFSALILELSTKKSELDSQTTEVFALKLKVSNLQNQLKEKEAELLHIPAPDPKLQPTSPEFEFSSEEFGDIEKEAGESDASFEDQVKGVIGLSPSPGTVVLTVPYDEITWKLVCIGDREYHWVKMGEKGSEESEEDAGEMEDRYLHLEMELVKKQQIVKKITDLLRHQMGGFNDVVEALERFIRQKSTPRQMTIPRVPVSTLNENKDDLLDTPRVMSATSPRGVSPSFEGQFLLLERGILHPGMKSHRKVIEETNSFEQGEGGIGEEPHSFGLSRPSDNTPRVGSSGLQDQDQVAYLQTELKERDAKLTEDAHQILMLQTENQQLKTDLLEDQDTVSNLEKQIKLLKEELQTLTRAQKLPSTVSFPLIRNSLLRLVAELPSQSRDTEDMLKTLLSMLGLAAPQLELVDQARKSSKKMKTALITQMMA